MKVKIITIHSIHNFGSVFQASALQQFLTNEGYDVEIIDYRPRYLDSGRNSLKTYVGRLLNYGAYISRKKKFDTFISNYMALTDDEYKNFDELKSLDNTADVFITGGDQLWNDYHFSGRDAAFKLTFVSEGEKVAFGTSMGRDNYTDDEINALLPSIHDYKFVGLREKSSVDFLKNCGLEKVEHVMDPVMLLDKSFFEKAAIKPKIEKYALLYLVDKTPQLDEVVDYITKNLGLKIVHVCGFRKKCRCDYFIKDSGPEEILGLLINAEFVISASFHATLFSVFFNKNFVSLLPNENTNARISEFLDLVGLKQRIVTNDKHLEVISKPVNYERVNIVVKEFSENSKSTLRKTLKNIAITSESERYA
jgi:hypothetical protein